MIEVLLLVGATVIFFLTFFLMAGVFVAFLLLSLISGIETVQKMDRK